MRFEYLGGNEHKFVVFPVFIACRKGSGSSGSVAVISVIITDFPLVGSFTIFPVSARPLKTILLFSNMISALLVF